MLIIDQYKYIKSRADFFIALDEAIKQTLDLLKKSPKDPYLDSILTQLDAIKRWTDGGREPTEDERKSLTIGPILVREFEPAQTDELEEWVERVREVSGYFRDWMDDATFASVDEDDLSDFPDD
ncbi:MAG: immunity protein Tsi6 family protein [Polyangiales bacterium]